MILAAAFPISLAFEAPVGTGAGRFTQPEGAYSIKRDPEIADSVQDSLLFFDGDRYNLQAWVVMPNDVHPLLTPSAGWELGQILHSWKSYTSSECNKLLGRKGDFWQTETFDRFVRDQRHYYNAISYIIRSKRGSLRNRKTGLGAAREGERRNSRDMGRPHRSQPGRNQPTPAKKGNGKDRNSVKAPAQDCMLLLPAHDCMSLMPGDDWQSPETPISVTYRACYMNSSISESKVSRPRPSGCLAIGPLRKAFSWSS
jgi:hypothetical protein